MTLLLLNGGTRTTGRLVYVNADGRNVWDDGGPDLLVEGIDCEVVPSPDGPTLADPFTPDLHEASARELERLAHAIAPTGPAPVVPQWAGMDDFGGSDF